MSIFLFGEAWTECSVILILGRSRGCKQSSKFWNFWLLYWYQCFHAHYEFIMVRALKCVNIGNLDGLPVVSIQNCSKLFSNKRNRVSMTSFVYCLRIVTLYFWLRKLWPLYNVGLQYVTLKIMSLTAWKKYPACQPERQHYCVSCLWHDCFEWMYLPLSVISEMD